MDLYAEGYVEVKTSSDGKYMVNVYMPDSIVNVGPSCTYWLEYQETFDMERRNTNVWSARRWSDWRLRDLLFEIEILRRVHKKAFPIVAKSCADEIARWGDNGPYAQADAARDYAWVAALWSSPVPGGMRLPEPYKSAAKKLQALRSEKRAERRAELGHK